MIIKKRLVHITRQGPFKAKLETKMLQSALDYDRFRNEMTLALIQGWRFIDIWTAAQLGNFERGAQVYL